MNKCLLIWLLTFVSISLISCGKNSSAVENILGFFLGAALLAYLIGFFSKSTKSKYYTSTDAKNDDLNGKACVFIVIILAVIVLIVFGLSNLIC